MGRPSLYVLITIRMRVGAETEKLDAETSYSILGFASFEFTH